MNEWQMQEYDELRLEAIDRAHGKYLEERIELLVSEIHNRYYKVAGRDMHHPIWHGYVYGIEGWYSYEDTLYVDVDRGENHYQESEFAEELLYLPQEQAVAQARAVIQKVLEDKARADADKATVARQVRIDQLRKELEHLTGEKA